MHGVVQSIFLSLHHHFQRFNHLFVLFFKHCHDWLQKIKSFVQLGSTLGRSLIHSTSSSYRFMHADRCFEELILNKERSLRHPNTTLQTYAPYRVLFQIIATANQCLCSFVSHHVFLRCIQIHILFDVRHRHQHRSRHLLDGFRDQIYTRYNETIQCSQVVHCE